MIEVLANTALVVIILQFLCIRNMLCTLNLHSVICLLYLIEVFENQTIQNKIRGINIRSIRQLWEITRYHWQTSKTFLNEEQYHIHGCTIQYCKNVNIRLVQFHLKYLVKLRFKEVGGVGGSWWGSHAMNTELTATFKHVTENLQTGRTGLLQLIVERKPRCKG